MEEAAFNVSGNETLPAYHPAIVAGISIAMAALSVVTVVGNAMVMLSFYLDKNIRQPANFYIFSLAASDFLIGLEGFPFYTIMTLQQEWRLGWFLCDLWLSIDYSVCLASIYTVLCITIDRYCSVKIPATYRNWRTPNKVLLIVAVVWTIPSLLFFTSVFGYGFFSGEGRILADNECYVQFMTNPYFNMGMYIGYYWTTLAVMIVLYAGIYRTAKGLQKKSEEKQKRLETMEQMRTTAQLVGSPVALHNAATSASTSVTAATRASRKGGSSRKRPGEPRACFPSYYFSAWQTSSSLAYWRRADRSRRASGGGQAVDKLGASGKMLWWLTVFSLLPLSLALPRKAMPCWDLPTTAEAVLAAGVEGESPATVAGLSPEQLAGHSFPAALVGGTLAVVLVIGVVAVAAAFRRRRRRRAAELSLSTQTVSGTPPTASTQASSEDSLA